MKSFDREILVAEDNPADLDLIKLGVQGWSTPLQISAVRSGLEAWEYLQKAKLQHFPELVILDLYMPNRDGLEILKAIKEDPLLRSIPVFLLTATDSVADTIRAYNLKVEGVFQKSCDVSEFLKSVKLIEQTWLENKSDNLCSK
jgi:CheY-like chemotaxis protein